MNKKIDSNAIAAAFDSESHEFKQAYVDAILSIVGES